MRPRAGIRPPYCGPLRYDIVAESNGRAPTSLIWINALFVGSRNKSRIRCLDRECERLEDINSIFGRMRDNKIDGRVVMKI